MNNKSLGTLIYWFFNDYIIKKVLVEQLFPPNLSLCFDFVIFLTMFLKGLDFCQFQVRSWKRNWGSRDDYDTLYTCMKVSENHF